MSYFLSIDQGTTSTRAIVFDVEFRIVGVAQKTFEQHFPQPGWVEHDAEVIWHDVISVCRDVLFKHHIPASQVTSIGITNQRETTIVWNRKTGKPIHKAIVWQDRRTAGHCKQLKIDDHEPQVREKTGLLLDPYFSATKLQWILDQVPNAREQAERGELAFGTIDSYILWHLTGGDVHATDATNASRTLLFNIHTQQWDEALLDLFKIPKSLLPVVKDSCADFGVTQTDLLGVAIPIGAIAGDQHAAMVGQTCFQVGSVKSTYGTGAFLLLNTGDEIAQSEHRLLSTIAYRIHGQPTYAIEGSVFVAGAAMQWLRDQVKLVHHAADSEALANSVQSTEGVYFVPAFTGLGAPHWEPNARGIMTGLTRDSNIAHIVRAGLESVAYSTCDLIGAMQADGHIQIAQVRVDGGMVANNWLCQFLADTLQVTIERPKVIETTALGVAYLAALQSGHFSSLKDIASHWCLDQSFSVQQSLSDRDRGYQGWQQAVRQALLV